MDSSGLTFTYLETPREFDAGILTLGHLVTPRMIIPPNDANYTVSAFCSVDCTEEVFIYLIFKSLVSYTAWFLWPVGPSL